MLSINTNLSSLIAQNSMKTSTNKLNQAVERMSTGYKINHAKDNVANYSIATNMTTKIGAYMVAEDNVLSGLDLVSTATEVITMMEDRASRLSALSIQARNGTYGAQSLEALNAEAGALASEIMRLYNSTQFNNVNLFNRSSFNLDENLPQAGESGFIEEPIATFAMRATPTSTSPPTAKAEYGGFIEDPKTYTDQQVADMKTITQAISESSLVSGGKYSISTKDELVALANYVNAGNDTTGMTFVLGADIDLSSVSDWTPIGDYSTNNSWQFKGVFDGNGHIIKDLTVTSGSYQGFFGYVASGEIKNLGIEGGTVQGGYESIGTLAGAATSSSSINNCYTNSNVKGSNDTGCFIGKMDTSSITNCYSTGSVTTSARYTGGLVGNCKNSTIVNSFSTSSVDSPSYYIGGLVGEAYNYCAFDNCYAMGDVKGGDVTGGLVGHSGESSSISFRNCFATGNVTSTNGTAGGLIGFGYNGSVIDCYATGSVKGTNTVGGLIGHNKYVSTSNSYATGSVSGTNNVGGLVGYIDGAQVGNCYSTGSVTGTSSVGGFAGNATWNTNISSSYATGSVSGTDSVGGFIGNTYVVVNIDNSYSQGSVDGENNVGGFLGSTNSRGTITTCYSTGDVSGESFVGGLVGQAYNVSDLMTYTQCHAYGKANGAEGVGGLIGGAVLTTNGTNFGRINIVDCQSVQQSAGSIGGVYQYDSATTTYTLLSNRDMSSMTSGIEEFTINPTTTTLHLGINGNDSSSLSFDTNFIFDFSPMNSSVDSEEFYNSVNGFVKHLQEKTTILGAVQNRLESALDEISIQYENLVSSRSTIRDADMAKESASYIQAQILQQAAATLMSTANQSPAIALQLI